MTTKTLTKYRSAWRNESERGAFSGALTRQDGRWKQAHLGTLFLDEIGDMSPLAQAKVLRAIETREILPLGAAKPIEVDIRIVAATNHDLESDDALLRRDLFYRLNVLRIVLPALRTGNRPKQSDVEFKGKAALSFS
jgi:Nif-specific regulatory protein